MSFGERAAARKRAKELKTEMKDLRRVLTAAGCDKAQVTNWLREFGEALELGNSIGEEYEEARRYLSQAQADIEDLLASLDGEEPRNLSERLKMLVEELTRARHECLIREDDLDFKSTLDGLAQMAQGRAQAAPGMKEIMLRSELENVRAVLMDAAAWNAPDFFAFAYYCVREDRAALGEMENEQRNALVSAYKKEHFEGAFLQECARAGVDRKVEELIITYTDKE